MYNSDHTRTLTPLLGKEIHKETPHARSSTPHNGAHLEFMRAYEFVQPKWHLQA